MFKIKKLMLNHPVLSIILILPFSTVFVFAVLELIITVVIPLVFALWLAGWIYGTIIGSSITRSIREPFWFIRSQRF